jgi:hypothetical protein
VQTFYRVGRVNDLSDFVGISEKGHHLFPDSVPDVHGSRVEYSDYFLRELDDEIHKHVPNYRDDSAHGAAGVLFPCLELVDETALVKTAKVTQKVNYQRRSVTFVRL